METDMNRTHLPNRPLHATGASLQGARAAQADEVSLGRLAVRLMAALWRVAWRCAARVLAVGDCNVH